MPDALHYNKYHFPLFSNSSIPIFISADIPTLISFYRSLNPHITHARPWCRCGSEKGFSVSKNEKREDYKMLLKPEITDLKERRVRAAFVFPTMHLVHDVTHVNKAIWWPVKM